MNKLLLALFFFITIFTSRANCLQCSNDFTISTNSIGYTTAEFSWTASPGAQSYQIYIGEGFELNVPPGAWIAISASQFSATNLLPGHYYRFFVRSVCESGEYSSYRVVTFFTLFENTQCAASEQCIYTFHTLDSFGDGWNGISMSVRQNGQEVGLINPGGTFGPNGPVFPIPLCAGQPFELYWNPGGSFASEIGIEIRNPFGQVIYYKQPGVGSMGSSLYTAEATCAANPCHTPTNLQIVSQMNMGQSTLQLYWSAGGATNWEIFITPPGAPGPDENDVGIPATSVPFSLPSVTAGDAFDVYIRSICGGTSSWSAPLSYAPELGIVYLYPFFDVNSNNVLDADEPPFYHGSFELQINGNPSYYLQNVYSPNPTFTSGMTSITDHNSGNSYNIGFELHPDFVPYAISPTTFENVVVANLHNTYYFPIQPIQPLQDLSVIVLANSAPRHGWNYTNVIRVRNNGYETLSGILTFSNHPYLTITSVSVPDAIFNEDGFEVPVTDLSAFETFDIVVNMEVSQAAAVGSTVHTSSQIIPQNGTDANPSNNSYTQQAIIVSSYDPNDKTESHGAQIDFDEFVEGEELTYSVRFQNTGTAPAFKVVIEDQLDAKLDEESVRILGTSHACTMERHGTLLKFVHEPIYLPQSNVNEQASQGFVTFAVKPKPGFAIGDIIPNTAEIFFDFNDPIITNTWTTEFVEQLGTPSFGQGDFVIYPNPAASSATLMVKNGFEAKSVTVYDLVGKLISRQMVSGQQSAIDLRQMSAGMYLIQVEISTGERATIKLIRE